MKEAARFVKYGSPGSCSLVGGGPLQVEDIVATLRVTTFQCPTPMRQSQVDRIVKNLNKRKIEYTLRKRIIPLPRCMWPTDIELEVSGKSVYIHLLK